MQLRRATADRAKWINLEGYEPGEVEQPPVIGFLARFIPGKGLGLVIDAFIELKKRDALPRCVCAASGDDGEDDAYVQTFEAKTRCRRSECDAEFLRMFRGEEKIAALQTLTLLPQPTQLR